MSDGPSESGRPSEGLVGFYEGTICDGRGRWLADIQSWGPNDLENVHDYVQWLFPLRRRSEFNHAAPILDSEVIAAFRARPELRIALVRSLNTMLQFYGFKLEGSDERPVVRYSHEFEGRGSNWLTAGNHNHLRITRILACLRTLGLELYAEAFFRALEELYWSETQELTHAISDETFAFWKNAAGLVKHRL
jgi:hypothetical protein